MCNINFWIENDSLWHFSKNSSDLVAGSFPYPCVWNCSQGRELTHFANTSTLSNYGKRWVKFVVSNNTIAKYFFPQEMEKHNKKEKIFLLNKILSLSVLIFTNQGPNLFPIIKQK